MPIDRVSIFPPSEPADCLEIIKHPERERGFLGLLGHCNVKGLIPYLEDEKIYFHDVGPFTTRVQEHFKRTGRGALHFNEEKFNPDFISWGCLADKLQKPIRISDNKYTDHRMTYTWEDKFLVQSYFTFGQINVARGTCHIIQVTKVPLLYYSLPSPDSKARTKYYKKHNVLIESRSLRVSDQYRYKRYILRPERNYKIPANSIYVLVALQKTLFSATVVKEDYVLPFHCRNPKECESLVNIDEFQDPPMTPSLDERRREEAEMEREEALETAAAISKAQAEATAASTTSTSTTDAERMPPPPAPMDTIYWIIDQPPAAAAEQQLPSTDAATFPSSPAPAATEKEAEEDDDELMDHQNEQSAVTKNDPYHPQTEPLSPSSPAPATPIVSTNSDFYYCPRTFVYEKCPEQFYTWYNTLTEKKELLEPPIPTNFIPSRMCEGETALDLKKSSQQPPQQLLDLMDMEIQGMLEAYQNSVSSSLEYSDMDDEFSNFFLP